MQDGSKDHLTIRTTDDIMKLTAMEQWVLNEYISSGNYKINELLRAGAILTESEKEWVDNLDSGFYTTVQYLSTAKGGVYNDDANFQIYIQNATKGRDISAINVSEKEVLYEMNSKFRVVQKVKKANM